MIRQSRERAGLRRALRRQGHGQPLDGADQPQKASDRRKRETIGVDRKAENPKVKSWFERYADARHEIPAVFDVARALQVKEPDRQRNAGAGLALQEPQGRPGAGEGGEDA